MLNNIDKIRISQHITSEELAQRLGVKSNSIRIKKEFSKLKLYKYAVALNTTGDRLLDKSLSSPHLEAFYLQGCRTRELLSASERIERVDQILNSMTESDFFKSIAPIQFLLAEKDKDAFCLKEYVGDIENTTETISDMKLMFTAGLMDADFFLCAAILNNRYSIIQSFYNGLCGIKEYRGGKNEFNNIETVRCQLGYSQSFLSDKCDIPQTTLKRIETNERCIDAHLNYAKKIAKVLKCDFTDLFSPAPKDMYNIQARKMGIRLRKEYDTHELKVELEKDARNLGFCVRDILAFLNHVEM